MATNTNATNYFSPARWVVSPTAGEGTHTTIAGANTSASAGDTIMVMPGTYSESPTMKAVNLTAFGSDSSLNGVGSVQITGKITFSSAGTLNIYGIQLNTSSDNFLAVTGSAISIVNLNNCYLNCSNNTGISYTTANTSSAINITKCFGNLGTTGIGYHTMSSTGNLSYLYCEGLNSGGSTTASTNSAGGVFHYWSIFTCIFSCSSTGAFSLFHTNYITSQINTTPITTAGSGTSNAQYCYFLSGSASGVSAGTGTVLSLNSCNISSGNSNAMTGAGSIRTNVTTFSGSSSLSNVTTQTGGAASGLTQGTAPSVGFIGEQIRSFVAKGSAVSLTTSTQTNITSISVTPGIWDITGFIQFAGSTVGTSIDVGFNTVTATLGTAGDNSIEVPFLSQATADYGVIIPNWRQNFSATTTVYLVGRMIYSVGTGTGYGRITAVRVG